MFAYSKHQIFQDIVVITIDDTGGVRAGQAKKNSGPFRLGFRFSGSGQNPSDQVLLPNQVLVPNQVQVDLTYSEPQLQTDVLPFVLTNVTFPMAQQLHPLRAI